jgi:hypothetical protein
LAEDQPVRGTIGNHGDLSGRNRQLIRVKYKHGKDHIHRNIL